MTDKPDHPPREGCDCPPCEHSRKPGPQWSAEERRQKEESLLTLLNERVPLTPTTT